MNNSPIRAISILRLYIGLSGVIIGCAMVRLLDRPESGGYQMGFLCALLSAIVLADTIINDLMPSNLVYERAKRFRNVGYMAMAVCYACCLFFIAQYREPPTLLLARLFLDALVCCAIAFAGLGESLEEANSKPRGKKPMA